MFWIGVLVGLLVGIIIASVFISIVTRARIAELESNNEFLHRQLLLAKQKLRNLKET